MKGGDRNRKRKEKNRHKQERRKLEKRKGLALVTKENVRCTNFKPLAYLRVNLLKRDHS